MTISTACILLHKFRAASTNEKEYDIYVRSIPVYLQSCQRIISYSKPFLSFQLVAAACIYLAGKIESQLIKIRDVINVTRGTLNRKSSPLDLGDAYWALRESIVQMELLLIRVLKFDLTIHHPQKV